MRTGSARFICSSVPGCASSNFTDSRRIAAHDRILRYVDGYRLVLTGSRRQKVMVPLAGSSALTRQPTPRFCQSSRSCSFCSAISSRLMTRMEEATTDLPSSQTRPLMIMRSPSCTSCSCIARAAFGSFCPGTTRSIRRTRTITAAAERSNACRMPTSNSSPRRGRNSAVCSEFRTAAGECVKSMGMAISARFEKVSADYV